MTSHDRIGIARRLANLPQGVRVMFAAMLAERMLPSADAYLRDRHAEAHDLRGAIDVLWGDARGERVAADEVRALLARCEAAIENAAAAESDESVYGENAAVVVAFGLRSLLSGDPEELGWASQRAYDTVDHFVMTLEPDEPGPVDNARILTHPVVQQELRRQVEDLDALARLAASGVDPKEVERLREAARRQARTFLAPERA